MGIPSADTVLFRAQRALDEEDCPPVVVDAIDKYIWSGVRPSAFLYAALCNDFDGVFRTVDPWNAPVMFAIARRIREVVPCTCWGSKRIVDAWIARGGMNGPPPSASATVSLPVEVRCV